MCTSATPRGLFDCGTCFPKCHSSTFWCVVGNRTSWRVERQGELCVGGSCASPGVVRRREWCVAGSRTSSGVVRRRGISLERRWFTNWVAYGNRLRRKYRVSGLIVAGHSSSYHAHPSLTIDVGFVFSCHPSSRVPKPWGKM